MSVSISNGQSSVSKGRDVPTTLNYIIPPGREGLKPIDADIPEAQRRFAKREGIMDVRDVVIKDIRGKEHEFTLDVQGFQYVKHAIEGVTDWHDAAQIKQIIQPATEELVKRLTGASEVVVYLTRTRFEGNEVGNQMSTQNSPSHGVHTDMTRASCRSVLKDVLTEDEIERRLSHPFVVVNAWRPIKTVRRDPLAVCDWRSVDPASDIVPDRRIISDHVVEFGLPVYNEKHDWYYLSEQQPDEPIIFKQLGSDAASSVTLLHSAFVDPEHIHGPPRESIEMKCFAFFTESTA
ncbi:hypothetical protein BO83DRAFT_368546 [Aspergillus eucalypticola CBS 122712]|uniref:Methyltransferase n=1 Tax=Aspergillus eucalypticola (strain CBS 122712 / IBT 29274) TaxID=1448314 RepID=A0A317UTP5_ASPEC|nr:uncharacterized protein BO83DRAFT_368546 [Aspergillus eucalypticola CBS 122712]PWY64841.1 hypothetical protein BO83DRAFT_368546 [Aspergillus eucalypticola CBS 122712]